MNDDVVAPTQATIDALLADLGRAGRDPHGLVVRHHGREVVRARWAPYDEETPALVYSVSKTLTALAIGCLVDDGLVDVDAPVDTYLDAPNPSGWRVRDLLTMSTGLSREQNLELPFDVEAILSAAPRHSRGTFAYSSPSSFVLGAIVRAVSGKDLTEFLRPRVLEPLGISRVWWQRVDDVEQGFSGLHISVADLALVGELLLQDGVWQRRRLLPAGYLADLATRQVPTAETDADTGDWSLGYGFQVWRSRHGYRLDGAYGQFVLVDPGRALVIAYQGATNDPQPTLDLLWRLAESIDSAAEPGPVGPEPRAAGLDAWADRGTLALGPELDVSAWDLKADDAAEAGWLLTLGGEDLPGEEVRVGADGWLVTVLGPTSARPRHARPEPDDVLDTLVLAARGETRPDGTVLIHLVTPLTPHRIVLERDAEGRLRARWHTAPLGLCALGTLLTPASLTPPELITAGDRP